MKSVSKNVEKHRQNINVQTHKIPELSNGDFIKQVENTEIDEALRGLVEELSNLAFPEK